MRCPRGMSERVLIAYGSKHGSTAETADAIGGMLREHGLEVDISEAARVKSLEGFDRVVLGGSIYMGRWHPDARGFVKRFADELSIIPVAIFAMGPQTSEPDDLAAAREELDANLRKLPDVGADPIAIFGGVINPAKLHFPFSRMPATDARDWQEIKAFADAVYSGSVQAAGIG